MNLIPCFHNLDKANNFSGIYQNNQEAAKLGLALKNYLLINWQRLEIVKVSPDCGIEIRRKQKFHVRMSRFPGVNVDVSENTAASNIFGNI